VLRDRDADGNGSLEERLYAQQDANWNVTAVVDIAGSVFERYLYEAYGAGAALDAGWTLLPNSNFSWTHGHQGGRAEAANGWYDFGHRWLIPALGRWNKIDPKGFVDGMN
jgi:RHS repeat-associated protein